MIYSTSLILLVGYVDSVSAKSEENESSIKLFSFKFDENAKYIIFSMFVIIICGIKVIYHWARFFSDYIPESNMLLLCGIAVGFIMRWIGMDTNHDIFSIKSDRFFNLLLPPIILEASFCMYHKTFASNIVGVMIFAFIATLLNFFFIGICLTYISNMHGIQFNSPNVNVSTFWVFSSLIVATDPVAVLAIFQEIHVDNNLYYLVFGESLLNDGVSVVLYEVMIIMCKLESILAHNIGKAVLYFCFVVIGGALVGCLFSILTCVLTRFTFKTPLTEPPLVLFFGYMSYLMAGAFEWSGIVSMIVYGVFQATYGFQNITQKSLILIKRLSKILSNLSEAVIFVSLGVSITKSTIHLLSSFTFWSLFLCLYGRFIFTLLLSAFINYFEFNIRKIAWNEQFIIAYGGLRGGIAYCLSFLIDEIKDIEVRDIQQTTIFIIIFTIFFMGQTMKPLVRLLNIEIEKPDEISLFVQITESAIDHLLAGIEEIIGMKGRNSIHEFLAKIDELYIRPLLQRDPLGREQKIMKVFEKMNLTIHMATTAPAGTQMAEYYLSKLKPQMRHLTMESAGKLDPLGSMHGSLNLKTYNEDTINEAKPKVDEDIVNLTAFNKICEPRQSSEIHMDHTRFANRMNAMLNLKRRSLAVTAPKAPPARLSLRFSKPLESETDLMTIEFKRKKNL